MITKDLADLCARSEKVEFRNFLKNVSAARAPSPNNSAEPNNYMSKEIQMEIPGIAESDYADLVAGARFACAGEGDRVDRFFAGMMAEVERMYALDAAEAAAAARGEITRTE